MPTTVTNQKELAAALAAKASTIYIDSPAGVWLTLTGRGSSRVVARGSSSVVAWGSSRVEARDSSSVEARDSSRVEAWGSSRVVARGSSSVVAWGSSRVEARDSSRVVAWDSSRVEARDSSSVEAGKYVAVHLWSTRVTLNGGVLIDLTGLDLTDPTQWVEYHGVTADESGHIVYKAVDADLVAGQRHTPTQYPIGGTVTAPDWQPSQECGYGLHFGPSPSGAAQYFNGTGEPRFLACRVTNLVALGDKCKAQSCEVLYEVDRHGDRIRQDAEATS